ncbi:MAG: TonB-dependent receptor, partial [Sphingomonas sp.]
MRFNAGASVAALLIGCAVPATAQTVAPTLPASEQSGTVAPSADQGVVGAQAEGSAPAQDDIVVTGVRASLQSAQNIKRNSAQIVDSIVAEDIGKLPDRNIAEALQRVS